MRLSTNAARFTWEEEKWRLSGVRPIAAAEIPETHLEFVVQRARDYFDRPTRVVSRNQDTRYDMAVLWSEKDPMPPSNEGGIRRLTKLENHQQTDGSFGVTNPDRQEGRRHGVLTCLLALQSVAAAQHP